MTAAWMAYGLLVGGLVAAAARGLDGLCQTLGLPRRWVWLAALALAATLVGLAPERAGSGAAAVRVVQVVEAGKPTRAVRRAEGVLARVARLRAEAREGLARALSAAGTAVPRGVERGLAIGWAATSAGLLLWLGLVHRRYRRLRRGWPAAEVVGTRVRVAPDAGPAVIGLVRPEIVVPRWLVCMGPAEQRMVLAHEREHVRAGDPALLAAGWVAAALLPWHPATWWMLSRLRLAVELDCDERVLRQGVRPRDYGTLLIEMAGRCSGPRVGAPALADESYHLERRLVAMRRQIPRFATLRVGALGLAAAAALLTACEAKLPTATELEAMDVAAAESGARRVRLVGLNDPTAVYTYDGNSISGEAARALTPDQIGAIEITKQDGAPSQIRITSREAAAKAGGRPVEHGKTAFRMRVTTKDGKPGQGEHVMLVEQNEEFKGVLLIDGVRAEPSALRTLAPDQIVKMEVIKGSAAAKLYDDPAAANGVMKITTKAAPKQ